MAARLLREKVFLWCMVKEMGRKLNFTALLAGSSWWRCLWVPSIVTLWLCRPSIWFFLWDIQFVFIEEVALGNTSNLLSLYFLRLFPLLVWFFFFFSEWMGLWNCLLGTLRFRQSLFSRECKTHDFYLGITNWIIMDLVEFTYSNGWSICMIQFLFY